jgi:fumarylacetoacetase
MTAHLMLPNASHQASLESWVPSAQDATTDFPVQNLPLGIFTVRGRAEAPRIGVAIGDQVLDVRQALDLRLLGGLEPEIASALSGTTLNALFALPTGHRTSLRAAVSALLARGNDADGLAAKGAPLLIAQADCQMHLPAAVGDYSDFYASIHHATNVGSMFRPDNPLLPNYKWVPIGYHGRASSIAPSGTAVHRPAGQLRDDASAPPVFGPTRRLDYEVEMGIWIGEGNAPGAPIAIEAAAGHMAGLSLLNDWSARDLQAWEYQPLGPFLAKSFLTTISPWVVTIDALAPFRVGSAERPAGDPAPLPYLTDRWDHSHGAFDIHLDLSITSAAMRSRGLAPMLVSRSNLRDLYWTPAQMVTHHTSNGCNLRPGDLLGSGTVSGPAPESRGCLLERTWRGTEPLTLPTGEQRRFLEDGDEVLLRGTAARAGWRPIGFGECRGVVTS